ncbi:MAG TPA: hypothetical protein VLT33_51165 [Labilithrix sp.]|nr:hypothetical protein [Labilithrix sp.]
MEDRDEPREAGPSAGFTWGDLLEDLVAREGTLTAVAEKLAAAGKWEEDVGSVERALRRLRGRGQKAGGKWGTRALAVFGLPGSVRARLRWMGAYHSRFTDLPVSVCDDLVRLWDHPPTTERREDRVWLALARATIALRGNDFIAAKAELDRAERDLTVAPEAAKIEAALVLGFIASRAAPEDVAALLARVPPLMKRVPEGDERACLHARYIDQRAYALGTKDDDDAVGAERESMYRQIPTENAPPFALCRRANGLAYALWKQGKKEEAAAHAREAARHAGDGGHVRMRAMALAMLARIERGPEGEEARQRATEISRRLEDETLKARFEKLPRR